MGTYARDAGPLRRRATWLGAFAIVSLIAGGLWWLRSRTLARVIAASRGDFRYVEARLSGGFAWAPLADANRGGAKPDARHLQLMSVAGETGQGVTAGQESNNARRAKAVALVLTGRHEMAIDVLRAIPETERDASIWSDLAAAHYALASRGQSPNHLKESLVAVDQAIRLDPASKEALFNRALVLEEYNLRDAAIDAWRDYLAVENEGEWPSEARRRLDALERSRVGSVQDETERHYARLERGDRIAAERLLEIDPGEVRYFFQNEVLGRWGEAWLNGDLAAAGRHLAAARTVAAALVAGNGEPMLADSVAAIERADRDATALLARGHVAFRRGRFVYRKERNATAAEPILAAAARDLAAGGSPMAGDARVFTAVAVFWQQRHREAEETFETLRRTVPAKYAALHGYIDWQLASPPMARAEWGDAIAHLSRAVEIFDRLGERDNAGYLRDILSQVYDAIGDRERAAANRAAALSQLGRTTNYRLEHVLVGMVHDALKAKEWQAAMSFLNVELHIARHVRDVELQTVVLLRRALLFARSGDAAAADRDLADASAVIASAADPSLKNKLRNDHSAAVALVSNDPANAIRLLTDVLRFHDAQGWRMLMPDLYLRRGRMYLAAGDRERAVGDFEAGIQELERHRESLPKGEARWGVLDAADELFDEAVTATFRSDARRAFEFAERERARSLTDDLPLGRNFDPSTVPAGAVLLEYSVLPQAVVIFAADARGFRIYETEIERQKLSSLQADIVAAFASGEHSRRRALARAVYDVLIAPVAGELATHDEVVLVPDSEILAVPFAALMNPQGQWLIEGHTITVAPSARFYLRARQRFSGSRRNAALIVDSPTTGDIGPLAFASREAASVSAEYPSPTRLSGTAATKPAVLDAMQRAEVIHFAVHGQTTEASSMLMLSSDEGGAVAVDHATIARLHLPQTSVVVLAACASGRGPVRRGEGQLSMARAFLQAGAPAVIATLWPISDRDAADFFPLLHRELARGLPAPEALRNAQLTYMRTSRGDRSRLWASVQVIGH